MTISPTSAENTPTRPTRTTWALLALRVGLLVGGITVLVLLIRGAGPEKVLATLMQAAVWLPLLIVLEAVWVSWDIFTIRSLYGKDAKRVPWWAWVRSALIAYPFMALFPAGRASAEAARATALARFVGGPRAAAAAAQGQGCMLMGNGLWSVVVMIGCGLALGFGHLLVIGVGANMLLGLIGGAVIILVLRGVKFGGWLGRLSSKLSRSGRAFDHYTREKRNFFTPVLLSTIGRSFQFAQYMFFVAAIGGALTLEAGMLSHGIHKVGAMIGDFVPNQVGVVDAAYAYFAKDVYAHFGFASLESAVAAVLAIELLRRIGQIFWSIIGAVVPIFWTVPFEGFKEHELEARHAEGTFGHPIHTYRDIASASASAEFSQPSPNGHESQDEHDYSASASSSGSGPYPVP